MAPEAARVALTQLRERLIALSDDVHRISRRLHPAILDDLGLTDAIRSECDRISNEDKIAVDFHGGRLPEYLPKDSALCLYRVAQEALRNAVKHSRAEPIDVTLSGDAEFLYLEVRDFGGGFDPVAGSQDWGWRVWKRECVWPTAPSQSAQHPTKERASR